MLLERNGVAISFFANKVSEDKEVSVLSVLMG